MRYGPNGAIDSEFSRPVAVVSAPVTPDGHAGRVALAVPANQRWFFYWNVDVRKSEHRAVPHFRKQNPDGEAYPPTGFCGFVGGPGSGYDDNPLCIADALNDPFQNDPSRIGALSAGVTFFDTGGQQDIIARPEPEFVD